VDVYAIGPADGNITTSFDLPQDVAGQDYFVNVSTDAEGDQDVMVSRGGTIASNTSLSGISSTKSVIGNTTGEGMNRISYDSSGV
jgi:hypothetical protein